MDSSAQSKRKSEDDLSETELGNKKLHGEEEFSRSEINADSTHLYSDYESNRLSSIDESIDISEDENTVLENTDQASSNSKRKDNNVIETLASKTDRRVSSLEKTVEFLKSVINAKDSLLENKDNETKYRDTKITNLEACLVEKDSMIKELTQIL